jgi:hypothetical protein
LYVLYFLLHLTSSVLGRSGRRARMYGGGFSLLRGTR